MNDYNILKNLLNTSETNNDKYNNYNENQNQNDICLISQERLQYNYIILDCGHRFNYESIYNEMVYQQTKKILDNKSIKLNQIKCPYCRSITNNNLPYFKYYNLKKITSLNNYNRFSILNQDISNNQCNKNIQNINRCNYINKFKQCNNIGCIENNDINICRCNKHNQYTKDDYNIINNLNNNDDYKLLKTYTIKQLKSILKTNNISCVGNKDSLAIKIILNNIKIE